MPDPDQKGIQSRAPVQAVDVNSRDCFQIHVHGPEVREIPVANLFRAL